MSEVQNASEANQPPTSSPELPDSPIPALVPSASAEGVDHLPPTITSDAPSPDTATPTEPIASTGPIEPTSSAPETLTTSPTPPADEISDADREYLAKLHASMNPPPPFMPMNAALKKFKETHAIKLESMDPHDPECQFILDRLAELNYHAAVERAETACDKVGFNMNKFPNAMKELNKAVSTLQREKARQARERTSKEKEQLRREREERAAQRAKEKQEHEERKLQHRIELEKQKQATKAINSKSKTSAIEAAPPPSQPQHSELGTQHSPCKPLENYPVCIPDPNAPDYDPVLDGEVTPCYG